MVKENQIIAALLGFISAVLLVVVLKSLQAFFIPLAFAILLYEVLRPVVDFAGEKLRVPMWLSLAVMTLFSFFIIYLSGLLVYANVNKFVAEFPRYEASLEQTLETTLQQINLPMEDFQAYITSTDMASRLEGIDVTSIVSSTLGSFFTFLGYFILVLILTLFIFSGPKTAQRLAIAFPRERAKKISLILNAIRSKVRKYLIVKIFISAMTGLTGVAFTLMFNVDFAIFAGLLLFAFNFIPNIGSIVASAFPVLICFLEYGYSWKVPGLAIAMTATQMFYGNYLEPVLMGRWLNLSPLVVILSLIFWGWVWGIIGMVIAVPLTSTFIIVFENVPSLRPLAVLMSGGKSISPAEETTEEPSSTNI